MILGRDSMEGYCVGCAGELDELGQRRIYKQEVGI